MWKEILTVSIVNRTDWQLSKPSNQRIFRLEQSNIPELGRVTIAQRLGDTYSDLRRFPASNDGFSVVFPYEGSIERSIAVKGATIKELNTPWQLKILESDFTEQGSGEPFLARLRQFELVNLEYKETKPNSINTNLVDTLFWVSVKAVAPYTIGRFHSEDKVFSDPLIHAPITLSGFFVTFTGKMRESRQIKVAIFKL